MTGLGPMTPRKMRPTAQNLPKWSNRILVEDERYKAELDLRNENC